MTKKPFKLKKQAKSIETTRKSYHDENLNKIKGRRGFVFTDFMTEKQRLERLEVIKRAEERYKINKLLSDAEDGPLLQQPNMRFKPRIDAERILEEVNKNNFGVVDKAELEKQLIEMDIGSIKPKIKKPGFLEYKDKNSFLNIEEESKKRGQKRKIEPKFLKKLLKTDNVPKTHFRAASTFIFKS